MVGLFGEQSSAEGAGQGSVKIAWRFAAATLCNRQ